MKKMIPKFRAWDKKYKKMMKVNQIDFEKKTVWLEADNGDHENRHTLTREFKDVILMQSTGLKDKNGVEIFEGDVVNIHWFYTDYDPETLGAIENEATAEKVVITKEFGNLGFWWNSGDDWVDLATLALTVQLHEESFELLGNVHENPELLEVK
ncbi:YopX family protein [Enterococcus faecalis]|uniref:YopX family protein n=3 Tax=Enterococcus TaxID=1350 RepID=UPI0035E41A2C